MYPSVNAIIVGHNSITREGLRRILVDEDFNVLQSVDHPSRLSSDGIEGQLLIVLDGAFEAEGYGSVCALRKRFPDARLVVLSEAFEFKAMIGAFRAGAHGYIVKEISCEPLIASLRLVAMGEKVMPSDLVDALPLHDAAAQREQDRNTLEKANLSSREAEILSCLIMGCPNKVISRRLSISEATVKVHVKAILRKLHVRNRTQAAIRGVIGGLDSRLDLEGNVFSDEDGEQDEEPSQSTRLPAAHRGAMPSISARMIREGGKRTVDASCGLAGD